MTSFIAWTGVDSRQPASIYLTSDSRISWAANQKIYGTWDCGRKLFASTKYPELLGYYGSIPFPSHVLAQILDLIDRDLLFETTYTPDKKFDLIYSVIRRSFKSYPSHDKANFTIIYCTRENEGMASTFHVAKIRWSLTRGWETAWLNIPTQSDIILTGGSGGRAVSHWYERWRNTTEKGTSRSIFSAFCDSLASGEDRQSGGSPQLVGIYRIGAAKTFGIVYEEKRYLFGIPVNKSENLNKVEWRNSLFERCNWETKKRLTNAQKHNRPIEL